MNIAAVAAEHVGQGGALTWRELSIKYDRNKEALRSACRRYLSKHTCANGNGAKTTHSAENGQLIEKISAPAPAPTPDLYAPYPPQLDDTDKWEDWKNKRRNQLPVTVMMLYDLHIPDQCELALKLVTDLAYVVQPEVIVFGGDMFDFDALGRFQQHVLRQRRDAYEEISETWDRIIFQLNSQCPRSKMVAFRGNHEKRPEDWAASTGGVLFETTENAFVNIIRANGRVWWLGLAQETHISNLIIKHGTRYGENAAKNTLKDLGWSVSIVQGHTHQPSHYLQRANHAGNGYKVIQAMSSGCLCNIPPHYQMNRKHDSKWLHGVVVGHVNLESDDVYLQNIVFHKRQNGAMYAYYGGTEVEVQP